MKRAVYLMFTVILLVVGCDKKGGTPEVQTSLNLNPQTVEFTAAALTSQSASVQSNTGWTVSGGASWLSITPMQGSGNGLLTFKAEPNPGKASREATVTVTAGSLSKQLKVVQRGDDSTPVVPKTLVWDGVKRGSMTYQLLVYSFADSDGDGIGDFKGIQEKLDYLESLGATALWLSPSHPTHSYHGYDVDDYNALNPKYAVGEHTSTKAEQDFQALLDAAHAKGIKIYMDYVLNHSGSGNAWFQSATSSADSPYARYYVLSAQVPSNVSGIDNFGGANYISQGMGGWHSVTSGGLSSGRLHFKLDWSGATKTITVTQTTAAAQASNSDASVERFVYFGDDKAYRMYKTADNIFEITLDYDSSWGFLIRTKDNSWATGTKYGAPSSGGNVTLGTPFALAPSTSTYDPGNLTIGGFSTNYYAAFDRAMPDLNYGPSASAKDSEAFKAIAATADKWIGMGVDGFRLDAVTWIYNEQIAHNVNFLKQWYDRCNATYQTLHPGENIFMVGEAWTGQHNSEKEYYAGLPSCFEFNYGWMLKDALNNASIGSYVSTVSGYLNDHKGVRSDAQTSFFLTNHDQDRFANDLGRDVDKEKQAAAILLTTPGKPFVYQGEELGYWGTKSGGDEYVRTPILWEAGKYAAGDLRGKVDTGMLTEAMSVKAQEANANSVLRVYKTFGVLRNTYPALADGTMSAGPSTGDQAVASWYMTANTGTQKLLVLHNVASGERTLSLSVDLSKPVALLGTASTSGGKLILGAHSSVVFEM